MAILVSINPPHTNNIFDNIKSIEWRTKRIPPGKCFCYETKKCFGLGKIIGEFEIRRVEKYENVSTIPEVYIELGCVPREFLKAYSKGRSLYAHFIAEPKRYKEPKKIDEFCAIDNDAVKKCEHRERVYTNPDFTNGAFLPGSYVCNKDETDWCGKCKTKPLTRPPQSWCYVESRDLQMT